MIKFEDINFPVILIIIRDDRTTAFSLYKIYSQDYLENNLLGLKILNAKSTKIFFVDLEGNKYNVAEVKRSNLIWNKDILFFNPSFKIEYIIEDKIKKISFEEVKRYAISFNKNSGIYRDVTNKIKDSTNLMELAIAIGLNNNEDS